MRFTFALFLLTFSSGIQAQDLSHPLFLSQGGAGGASLKEDFSYIINPAALGFQRRTKGITAYSFKENQKTAILSFIDRKTRIPVAVTYQRFWSESFRKSEKNTVLFSSGLQLAPFFSIGVAVERELKTSEWNGGIGSTLILGNQLGMSVFMNNILEKENENQRVLSLAGYYNWKSFFSTKIDVSRTAQKEWIFRGGIESLFQNFFSIRLGGAWFYEKEKGLISGGLGFHGPRLLLEYSVEMDEEIYQQAVMLSLYI